MRSSAATTSGVPVTEGTFFSRFEKIVRRRSAAPSRGLFVDALARRVGDGGGVRVFLRERFEEQDEPRRIGFALPFDDVARRIAREAERDGA
jgi:hypothetical protein